MPSQEEALNNLLNALQHSPDNLPLRKHVIMLLLELDRLEEAEEQLSKAIKLDPLHPTWFYISIAVHHFERGEYEEALVAARKINIPRLYWPQIYLAAIYAQLGRQREAEAALEELLKLYPGFSIEILVEELRKYNATGDTIESYSAALRKAGLPE